MPDIVKAPDAFRTISEVAEELDLPQHVLRFWETRFSQIKPMKRGGGRRYYRPEDIDLLRGIRLLLYSEGFTIRGVQRLLKDKGVGFVVSVGQNGAAHMVSAARVAAEPSFDEEPDTDVELAGEDVTTSPPQPVPIHPRPVAAMSREGRLKLELALAELQEVKRLLDQPR